MCALMCVCTYTYMICFSTVDVIILLLTSCLPTIMGCTIELSQSKIFPSANFARDLVTAARKSFRSQLKFPVPTQTV